MKMMRKLVMRPKFRMCVCMTERERRSASEMCLCVTDSEGASQYFYLIECVKTETFFSITIECSHILLKLKYKIAFLRKTYLDAAVM